MRDDKAAAAESAPSDLIGGLDLDAQPAAPAPASIDLLGETMASTPAPPPAAPAATAADDLLGWMSDIPTLTAQGASQATAHNGAGDLLDGLSSLTSPNPTQHATPPAADDVARWTALAFWTTACFTRTQRSRHALHQPHPRQPRRSRFTTPRAKCRVLRQ